MFKLLKDAFKDKEIRSRIFFTLFILIVFRIGAHITVPGVDASKLQELSDLPFLNMLGMVSGGAIENYSIFSMGVSPYITASIIVQLLQMDIVPKFVEWSKQGEVGRRKLNQANRYIALVIGMGQSMALTAGFNSLSTFNVTDQTDFKTYLVIGVILTAGSMFVTWLGEQITEKGIGNGVSMLIFAGIVSRVPGAVKEIVDDYFINVDPSRIGKSAVFVAVLLVAILIIVTAVTFFEQAERKIPIQYTKRVTGAPQSSYLPLKVNAAGVIPVIFAGSLITLPSTILRAFGTQFEGAGWYKVMMELFSYNTTPGAILYTVLIVVFTFFYAFIQVNPEKMAENLQKQGSYIPSVRPGKPTEDFVSGLLTRMSVVGAAYLGIIALLPIIAQNTWNLPQAIGLGGTSLLILVSVALDTSKQLEGLLLKRKYNGFMH
ncbi:preprotein translocase subunit SecY [Enterococcus sp. PF1-24]|uniref:preprotein translocase subunit SecY n=1 Tax=unclassified Enterococcus TaxID=2608891 RepID=UPI002475421B|nr:MULTISPECIES: preprotein translocase subunit SecY [unclassified Enterococcus]MDH6365053.1 preprotein translocase subunit SecY [Enterococcus sp. PFB1-1]MDH6402174.1 preprotein translocase subunit SecY [Enterococcus sp. PF1-24]